MPNLSRTGAISARGGLAALATVICWVGSAGAASAQNVGDNFVNPSLPLEFDRGRNTGVLDRARPEYEAPGLPLGGFTLRPRIEGMAGWTDNVYATAAKVSDGYFDLIPSATLNSNWSRNALGLDAGGQFRRFLHETRRDQDGWHVGLNGRYDLGGSGSISASVRTERASEPATSAAFPTAAAEASQYQVTTAQLAPSYAFGRIKAQLSYNFAAFSFDPVRSFANTIIAQANRDSTRHSIMGRGEYAISPDTSVFAQASYDNLTYSHELLAGVANRDSQSWRGLGGLTFDLATKIRGSVGVGYFTRRYRVPLYRDISGLTAELRVDYFVSPLTTLTLTGRRLVEDAGSVNSGGFINNSIALRADHELLRNLLLDAQVAYEHDDFPGVIQTVDIVRFSGGARYIANRSFGFGLSVSHDSRSANGVLGLSSFGETRVMVSVVVQK